MDWANGSFSFFEKRKVALRVNLPFFKKEKARMSMLQNFRSYQLALELHQACEQLKAKAAIRDQLSRASLSIVLNLAEGSAKPTAPERRRFYAIALGSLRETEALLHILRAQPQLALVNRLGGCVYRLVHPRGV
jgi:four helix bundle protein